jgi:hypothetical protein
MTGHANKVSSSFCVIAREWKNGDAPHSFAMLGVT